MPLLDRASTSALTKLVVFIAVTVLATALLVVTIGNLSFGDRKTYRAEFEDVTGVAKGDDVRIAGVRVGSVKKVEATDSGTAVLTFDVASTSRLTTASDVAIRFRNLIGQRYLSITQGARGATSPLKEDALVPMSRTTEALDLNVLFDGFKPLFKGLSPDQTNKLSFEIIQLLQGEGGTVQSLLARTSSLTQTLANRDELVGEVITNLNDVLETVGDRDQELGRTIDTLQALATGLKDDRESILGSLDSVADLTTTTAGLVEDARAPLSADISQLDDLTTGLNTTKNKATIAKSLQILPEKLNKLGNTATTGSHFNFYLCNITGSVTLPPIPILNLDQAVPLDIDASTPNVKRCATGDGS
ncbi:MCE family protein [Solicola sp. PLA-1-18]|uniref:MCE family protein n=1 Tax=Solicola sp. PLA-1-18 TaxID=3380532 RepID=UPI003B81EB32